MSQVVKGQIYAYRGLMCSVTRVARNGKWADIKVFNQRSAVPMWGKRQPLPMPREFELVTE